MHTVHTRALTHTVHVRVSTRGNTCRYTCTHMYTHSHASTHAHTCAHTGIHARSHAHTCAHKHRHTCTRAWAHTRSHTHVQAHECSRMYACTRMHGHTCLHAHTHACAHVWTHTRSHTCMGTHVFARMRTCTCMGAHVLTHTHLHTRLPTLPTPTAPCRCRLPADSPRSRRVVSAHMVDPWQRQAVETLRGRGEGRRWPGLSTGWAGCCFSHPSLTPEDGGLQRARDRPGVCRPQVSQEPRRPTYHPASSLPSQISPSSRREGPLSRACALCHPKRTT